MTDGRDMFPKALHANRAGVHRNRPAIVDITMFGAAFKERIEELRSVENNGLTTLRVVDNLMDGYLKMEVPDMFGLTQEEIDALPPYLRYLKCEDMFEHGDPFCKAK
jgi:hypothetical protein